jgi:hypothetical protein
MARFSKPSSDNYFQNSKGICEIIFLNVYKYSFCTQKLGQKIKVKVFAMVRLKNNFLNPYTAGAIKSAGVKEEL